MKWLQMIAVGGLLLAGFSSCSKEKEELYDPVDAMYETYTGRQGAGVEEPGNFLRLQLDNNGSLLAFTGNEAMAGAGSWEVNGPRFNGRFRQRSNNMIMHLSGVYDPLENKITGTWGYGEFTTGGGSFYIVKDSRQTASLKKKKNFPAGNFIDRFF